MHRHHGGNSQHKKECVWNGPSRILKILRKTLRVSQLVCNDSPPKIKILTQSLVLKKSRTSGQELPTVQSHNLQQSSLLLQAYRQNSNCPHLPYPSSRNGIKNITTKDFSRYTFEPLCCTKSTRET